MLPRSARLSRASGQGCSRAASDGSDYDRSEDELWLLAEVSFKPGLLRIVIINLVSIGDQVVTHLREKVQRTRIPLCS